MSRRNPFDWTKDRVAELRSMRAAGWTGTQMAEHFGHGLSRSAVLGKANRLDTPPRPAAVTTPLPVQRMPVPTLVDRRTLPPHSNACVCGGPCQPGFKLCAECDGKRINRQYVYKNRPNGKPLGVR